jgi:hypothetical protein
MSRNENRESFSIAFVHACKSKRNIQQLSCFDINKTNGNGSEEQRKKPQKSVNETLEDLFVSAFYRETKNFFRLSLSAL